MHRPDIPVYLGEERPLIRPYVDAADTHGENGLGNLVCPQVTKVRPRRGAVEFLAEALTEASETGSPVSVIALGPLTNLARLIQRHPECFAGLDEFVSMGGNYRSHGNCSPVAEYNYWCDPHAARTVFEAFASLPSLQGPAAAHGRPGCDKTDRSDPESQRLFLPSGSGARRPDPQHDGFLHGFPLAAGGPDRLRDQ